MRQSFLCPLSISKLDRNFWSLIFKIETQHPKSRVSIFKILKNETLKRAHHPSLSHARRLYFARF